LICQEELQNIPPRMKEFTVAGAGGSSASWPQQLNKISASFRQHPRFIIYVHLFQKQNYYNDLLGTQKQK
jgi:hypothetical protein